MNLHNQCWKSEEYSRSNDAHYVIYANVELEPSQALL